MGSIVLCNTGADSLSKIDLDTPEERIHELLNKKLEEVKAFEKALSAKMGV